MNYMRRILVLFVFAVIGCTALSAQPILTPYQYRHRFFVSAEGGASLFVCDYANVFGNHGRGGDLFSPYGELALGYYFTDAHEIRVSLGYNMKKAVLPPYEGFFPYKFHSVNFFADYVLNFYPMEELNIPLNPQIYVGLGAGYSFGFSEPEYHLNDPDKQNLDEVKALLPKPYPQNLTPAVRLGFILEYDFPNNLGLVLDCGAMFFGDRYSGQDPLDFPVDIQVNVMMGVVYHLGHSKIVKR